MGRPHVAPCLRRIRPAPGAPGGVYGSQPAVLAVRLALLLAFLLPSCAERTPPPAEAPVRTSVVADSSVLPRQIPTEALVPTPIRITVASLPAPYASQSASRNPDVIDPPAGARLRVPAGFAVQLFADGLDGPRWLALGPDGSVLVAESRENRIRRLDDRDGDGVAESNAVLADGRNGLNQPLGMALVGDDLFVGNTDAVMRYRLAAGRVEGRGTKIADLPGGGYNQHWTRNVVTNRTADSLYVTVGSQSNVDPEELPRASVFRIALDGSGRQTVSFGLRNPVGLALEPTTGEPYVAVNERDRLGDDLVPDYFTRIGGGRFFGWPFAYLAPGNLDPRRLEDGRSERPDLAAQTTTPDVLFQAHSAALGVAFQPTDGPFPAHYRGGAFVAMRGSWNRSAGTGYKVVFVPFAGGRPVGHYEDFLTGFLTDPTGPTTWARPVGLLTLRDGSLLVTDDANGRIYRVSAVG